MLLRRGRGFRRPPPPTGSPALGAVVAADQVVGEGRAEERAEGRVAVDVPGPGETLAAMRKQHDQATT